MVKKIYESDSDSDSEDESKEKIMKMIKKHSKKHGTGFFDSFKKPFEKAASYVTDKRGLASDTLHYGLPVAAGAAGSYAGGPMGGMAGSMAGKMGADAIARDQGMRTGYGIHVDINSHNASGRKAKTGMGFFTDLANDLRPITTDPRMQHLITSGLERGTRAIEGSGFFTDLANDLRPVTTDPRVQRLITAGLDRGTRAIEGSGFFTDLADDLRPVMTDPRMQRLVTAGLGRATSAIEGSGMMDDLRGMYDRGRDSASNWVQHEKETTMGKARKMGEGMKSKKRAKDAVSKRAIDEYIQNEMARADRKDKAIARQERDVRMGVKPTKTGGYGYGLKKGSVEMKEKMARLRAMKKK